MRSMVLVVGWLSFLLAEILTVAGAFHHWGALGVGFAIVLFPLAMITLILKGALAILLFVGIAIGAALVAGLLDPQRSGQSA